MGKMKRKRLGISRYSPTHINSNGQSRLHSSNLPSSSSNGSAPEPLLFSPESVKTSFNKEEGGLKTIQEKVLSSITEERVTGLNMLAALALESKAAESIIENKMITCIAPLLEDASSQVRLGAAGALRNLCAWGSDDDIELIVQQDILQPLSKLLKTYETNVPQGVGSDSPYNKFNKGVANSMDESDPQDLIFIQAINVLWSLCECNEEALRKFNQDGLVTILLKHINPFVWNYPISLAVADCLLCVSENNPKVTSEVLPLAETLLSLVFKSLSSNCNALGLQFAIVISGVLLNIDFWVPGDSKFQQVFEVLNRVLEVDAASHLSVAEGVSKAAAQENFERSISAQLVAFEMLSNICAPDEDDDYVECEDTGEELEEDSAMECENGTNESHLPIEVLEGIKYFKLVEKTYSKISLPDLMGLDKTEEEKSIHDKFCQLQIRALQCLQNLVTCLTIADLGGSDTMYSTWLSLGKMSFDNSPQSDLLEATSGAMRAIIQKLTEDESPKQINLSGNELQVIFNAVLSCQVAPVRSNLCRMIGTLGCSFIKHASNESILSVDGRDFLTPIVEFLLKVSQSDSALWVRAEALDVLIDVFSDDKTDHLAAHARLVERLREIQPEFKAKYNQQKKNLGDHRPLVLTVKDNLNAFIKYKGPRTSKLSKNH